MAPNSAVLSFERLCQPLTSHVSLDVESLPLFGTTTGGIAWVRSEVVKLKSDRAQNSVFSFCAAPNIYFSIRHLKINGLSHTL